MSMTVEAVGQRPMENTTSGHKAAAPAKVETARGQTFRVVVVADEPCASVPGARVKGGTSIATVTINEDVPLRFLEKLLGRNGVKLVR